MDSESTNALRDDDLADLARLVDGTLPADRRAEVEARVATSPQLSRLVEQQRVAVNALQGTAEIGASARLRAEVDRRRGVGRTSVRTRRRFTIRGALAGAAAVALALAIVLPGALSGGPSVADAAALAQKPPTQAAPADVPGTPQLLKAAVDDVRFPDYAAKFGWKPVGVRRDKLSGREAITVYYRKGSRTIAYTIIAGDALDPPSGARSVKHGGVEFHAFSHDGRPVVTWERGGHTCVLSGAAVRPTELFTLADWRGKGAIPF